MVNSQTLQQRFFDVQKKEFRINAIKRYFHDVVRFREKLAILVHITAG